jgi:hypothetical protein
MHKNWRQIDRPRQILKEKVKLYDVLILMEKHYGKLNSEMGLFY